MPKLDKFPNTKGFSVCNIWNMRKWCSFYACDENGRNLIGKDDLHVILDYVKLPQVGAETIFNFVLTIKK